MAVYSEWDAPKEGRSFESAKVVQIAGATASLALVVGIGVWGYQLVMRDVSGVPVVRAMEGPMRVAPVDPGGQVAPHTGLSVNSVAALGGAVAPEASEMLILAPEVVGLTDEDLSVQPTAEAGEVLPQGVEIAPAAPVPAAPEEAAPMELALAAPQSAPEPAAPSVQQQVELPQAAGVTPLSAEDIIAMADALAAGVEPMKVATAPKPQDIQLSVNGVPVDVIKDIVPASVPGVAVSPRPLARPSSLIVRAAAPAPVAAPQAAPAQSSGNLITAHVPVGTNLVQLGAFDSAEIAAKEWTRFSGKFPDYMADKSRVIQKAERGGRTFYRLRAMNFGDLDDARRFCAALSAEGTDCVPVVVR